jgi:hypothetical protein
MHAQRERENARARARERDVNDMKMDMDKEICRAYGYPCVSMYLYEYSCVYAQCVHVCVSVYLCAYVCVYTCVDGWVGVYHEAAT